jgi:PAS domain S-box-containing protein
MSSERDALGQSPLASSTVGAIKDALIPWLIVDIRSMGILGSNPAAQVWFKTSEESLYEQCLTDFLRSEDLPDLSRFIQGNDPSLPSRIWNFYLSDSKPGQAELMMLPVSGSETLRLIGIQDVSERERLRAERDQMLARYEALAVQSQQYFWEWDLIGGTIRRSVGLMESLGFTDPLTVQTIDWWQDRIHPADRDHVIGSIFRAVEDKRLNWSAEYRFQKASGHYAHIYDQGILTLDQFGKPSRIIGSMYDITERRSAEIERDRFIEWSPDLKAVLDASGNVIRANAALREILGVTSEEIQDQPFQNWIHVDDFPNFERLCDQIRIDEIRQIVTLRTSHNREILLNLSAYLPTGQIYITGSDVTIERSERRQAHLIETAIQNSHDLTLISEQLNTPHEWRITYANPAIQSVLGYSESEVMGRAISSFLADADDEEKYRDIPDRLKNGIALSEELPFRHRNGDTVWMDANIHPIIDKDRTVTHAVLVGRNVTQRKLDQQAIRAANRRILRPGSGLRADLHEYSSGEHPTNKACR